MFENVSSEEISFALNDEPSIVFTDDEDDEEDKDEEEEVIVGTKTRASKVP